MATLPGTYGCSSKEDIDHLGTTQCPRTQQNLQHWLLSRPFNEQCLGALAQLGKSMVSCAELNHLLHISIGVC